MNENEVVELMKSSKTEKEWNDNCNKVKFIYSGYPIFWYRTIVLSGVATETAKSWGGNAEIHIEIIC